MTLDSACQRLIIWDSSAMPPLPQLDSFIILWSSYGSTERSLSLPEYVESNSKRLRAKYLSWIYDLGDISYLGIPVVDLMHVRAHFSAWWSSLLNQSSNIIITPEICDVLKVLALNELLFGSALNQIHIVSSNKILASILREWASKKNLTSSWTSTPDCTYSCPKYSAFQLSLPILIAHSLLNLIRYCWSHRALVGAGVSQWRTISATTAFVSFFQQLDVTKPINTFLRSAYWGVLPELLFKKNLQTRWLHIWSPSSTVPTAVDARFLLDSLNSRSRGLQSHVFIDSFLTPGIILRAVSDWIRLICNCFHLESVFSRYEDGHINPWLFMRASWRFSLYGSHALDNLLYLGLFEAAFDLSIRQDHCFYLQENQGWEFCCVSAWRHAGHSGSMGVPHSTIRFWDLRYFFDVRAFKNRYLCNLPLPDKVILNGPHAVSSVLEGGYPPSQIFRAEALRYLSFARDRPRTSNFLSSPSKNGNSLLVLGDITPEITYRQLAFLEYVLPSIPGLSVTFKPHPCGEASLSHFSHLSSLANISTDSIADLVPGFASAFVSSNTSASVDAFCFGLRVITYLDPCSLNLSPLKGMPGSLYVSSLAGFIYALKHPLQAAPSPSDFFYLDHDLPRWSNILRGLY